MTEDAARLSKMLWDAREQLDMYADILAYRGSEFKRVSRTRDDIDQYRKEQGWSKNGFGGEQ